VSGSEKRNYPLGERGADIGGRQRESRIEAALLAASLLQPPYRCRSPLPSRNQMHVEWGGLGEVILVPFTFEVVPTTTQLHYRDHRAEMLSQFRGLAWFAPAGLV
jgi:hypothetical protein